MYTLKQIAQRGTAWGGVAAFVVAAVAPLASPAFADDLNPLTDRSLTLSSSAPGWDYTDGSGNMTYAQPNSGANGKQTGNTFSFKVSTNSTDTGTDEPIKAMTFQYCTTSAGECYAPGNNGWTDDGENPITRNADSATTSDLRVVTSSPAEVDNDDFATVVGSDGTVQAVPGFTDPNNPANTANQFAAKDVAGNFVVYYKDGSTWTQSEGWTMEASNNEFADVADTTDDKHAPTGQNNFITLKSTAGQGFEAGQEVKVVFFGTEDNYITNPGAGAFFVKINTYNSDATQDDTTLVDGGVTVANVMNHSIKIQTKVLETMKFSVGTVDPNTLDSTGGASSELATANPGLTTHGPCDPIATGIEANKAVNVLKLGNQAAESSLSDEDTYGTHSYWRLSSNSSAGATVYYSGVTLSNTVGDKITPMATTAEQSHSGKEQFGLALMNSVATSEAGDTDTGVDYTQVASFENAPDNGKTAVHDTTLTNNGAVYDSGEDEWDYSNLNASWHTPRLYPLVAEGAYAGGSGTFQSGGSATFAFDETSNSVPVALATEDQQVVDCVTGKMRYIANIASTTPAGIYTTAINYIAAPQY